MLIDNSIEMVKQWLETKHNNKSTTYNSNPESARADIIPCAESVYKFPKGTPRITQKQVHHIYTRLFSPEGSQRLSITAKYRKSALRNLLIFTCGMTATIEMLSNSMGSAELSVLDMTHHDTHVAAVAESFTAKIARGSVNTRAKYLKLIYATGIITVMRTHDRGRATVYQVEKEYPRRTVPGLPVNEAIMKYLAKNNRWKTLCDRMTWRRMRLAMAQNPTSNHST